MGLQDERALLPNPPAPWYWQYRDTADWWELVHQDPHEGIVRAAYITRQQLLDPSDEAAGLLAATVEKLPPTYIAKSGRVPDGAS